MLCLRLLPYLTVPQEQNKMGQRGPLNVPKWSFHDDKSNWIIHPQKRPDWKGKGIPRIFNGPKASKGQFPYQVIFVHLLLRLGQSIKFGSMPNPVKYFHLAFGVSQIIECYWWLGDKE